MRCRHFLGDAAKGEILVKLGAGREVCISIFMSLANVIVYKMKDYSSFTVYRAAAVVYIIFVIVYSQIVQSLNWQGKRGVTQTWQSDYCMCTGTVVVIQLQCIDAVDD